MKILLCSHFFSPSIGGIETLSLALAERFTIAGHEVVVLTRSPSESEDKFPYKVVREPSALQLWKLVRWSDVVFHNNICASMAWPLALVKRPWVIAHHTWITGTDGSIGFRERLKRRLVGRARQIAVSHSLAADLGGNAVVIGACYDDKTFRIYPNRDRERDLVFVGRLVSDKGADMLIDAIGSLKQIGKQLSLTIIGVGDEDERLRAQSKRLGVEDQIQFKGRLVGEALVQEISRHHVMVIPSRWKEPFGIVALEGLACGCAVIGSDGGGLPDAIGPCGLTFPNGNLDELVNAIDRLVSSLELRKQLLDHAPDHLTLFTQESVATRYLEVLQEAVQ